MLSLLINMPMGMLDTFILKLLFLIQWTSDQWWAVGESVTIIDYLSPSYVYVIFAILLTVWHLLNVRIFYRVIRQCSLYVTGAFHFVITIMQKKFALVRKKSADMIWCCQTICKVLLLWILLYCQILSNIYANFWHETVEKYVDLAEAHALWW